MCDDPGLVIDAGPQGDPRGVTRVRRGEFLAIRRDMAHRPSRGARDERENELVDGESFPTEIAAKRGVPVEQLPPTATWVDNIELDEERM